MTGDHVDAVHVEADLEFGPCGDPDCPTGGVDRVGGAVARLWVVE